jgi:hypothetical protein
MANVARMQDLLSAAVFLKLEPLRRESRVRDGAEVLLTYINEMLCLTDNYSQLIAVVFQAASVVSAKGGGASDNAGPAQAVSCIKTEMGERI